MEGNIHEVEEELDEDCECCEYMHWGMCEGIHREHPDFCPYFLPDEDEE